jgi:hypothetical protein
MASVALLFNTAAAAPRRTAAAPARASLAGKASARAALRDPDEVPLTVAVPGAVVQGSTISLSGSATVNFADLARMEAQLRLSQPAGEPRIRVPSELNESEMEVPSTGPPAFTPAILTRPSLNIASPSPSIIFQGLDDIPMVDSSYIIIPPDIGGGVGPTKVMDTFNNNYRIQDKITGATLSTVGTATFWNPVVTNKALLNQLTDPRTTYDPIQGRWIVCMQTTNNPGLILFGVSVTSDPSGSWNLFAVSPGFTSSPVLDFPIIGFNKNWLVVTINAYTAAGAFNRGGTMIANYPLAAAGTLASVTNITQAAGSHFCTAPCVTLSATEDTLFLVTHLSSAGGTFVVDRITGTAATPTYTTGATTTRTGGGWVQPSGNLLPQSAPNAGVSACGATPCPIETQDSQVRTSPMFRVDATTGRGFIYYTQTVGLPSTGQTHTGVQWTKLTASTTAPALADGGRIEDATATSTNGGKWYAFPHIAVNSSGDWIIGYSQFSSAQHPSAGYSYHNHVDGLGTMRDPLIYKAGEDYYHKTFSTATGRNRWGDFTTAQVDPADDQTLWVLQEYGKTRVNTDDGNTGANGSRWSTYWAAVGTSPSFTITASAGAGGTISPSGGLAVNQGANQAFTITANSCFHITDVLVDGVSQGAISTFTFTNVQAAHTISASFAINGPFTITASAGANGSVTPAGATVLACGNSQAYAITAAPCFHITDVLVDGVSQGAISAFTFTNAQANHTISASFAINGPFTITASAGANGSVTPSGPTLLACGNSQAYAIAAAPCYHVADVLVDGVSQGAISVFTFTNVQASHTISATFAINTYTITASPGLNGTISPNGVTTLDCAANQSYVIAPNSGYYLSGLTVDGSPVTPASPYTFTNVQANHTIAASFSLDIATIAGTSSTSVLCPTNTCVTIPITFARNGGTPLLGYSVTFQLSANLDLCLGTASITEGGFLSASGGTLFNIVNRGGGLYSVDDALSANCGASGTSGTLFSIGVKSSAAGGTGSVTITSLKLRDCSNANLATTAGPPATVPIDNLAPVVTVLSPNGGETLTPGGAFPITWSASDNVGVANVDIAYSTDGGASYPNVLATAIANTGTFAWTVPGASASTARVRVTAHDVNCSSTADASDADFAIGGNTVGPVAPVGCVTAANCATVPVNITRSDPTSIRSFQVSFTLSANLTLCGPIGSAVLEGSYMSNVNPGTTFSVVDNGGGSYTADGAITGVPCGATAASGNLFNVKVAHNNASGTGTVTVTAVSLQDCASQIIAATTAGPAASITIDTAPVSVAAISTPQPVVELSLLTITPSMTLTSCATGPVTWSVSPALPGGALLSTSTGEVTWTPACGTANTYGPFTLTATAASGDAGSSNSFQIIVSPKTYTIVASAGAGGVISPAGNVSVNCGSGQAFTITPTAGFHVEDVLVDGISVGAVTTSTFTNVIANHTIAATFTGDARLLTVNIAGGGTVTRLPDLPSYVNGSTVQLTANANAGWAFSAWSGNLVSTNNPENLLMNADQTVTSTFLDIAAPTMTVTAPNGNEVFNVGNNSSLSWIATDNAAVTAVDLELSRAGVGGPYESVASGLANTGTYSWLVTAPATTHAVARATAHDAAGHTTQDLSDAEFSIANGAGVNDGPVMDFALSPVWPNPVHSSMRFQFALPREANVHVGVYDLQGRELLVLGNGAFAAGHHSLEWSSAAGARLDPGLYFIRLAVPGRSLVRRFVLMQ